LCFICCALEGVFKGLILQHVPCDIEFEELVEAYFDCRRNKRTTHSALDFEMNLEENLLQLYHELRTGTYEIGKSICFVVKIPRVREIWAANFRDRIVHHLIYNRMSPKWNRRFSADSCACIPGRGTLYGATRLEKHIRSFTNNWEKDYWYLKCDLSNFFVSIKKDVLWSLMEPSIEDGWLKDITKLVLYSDPTKNFTLNSRDWEAELVPERKRLCLAGENTGLPIGNLTSQFFANILLNELDKFAKHTLKAKKYIRYVDDCIILAEDKETLIEMKAKMDEFVKTIGLSFNPKKCFIHKINRGVSFVGQTVYPHRRVPLKNTVDKCIEKAITSPDSIPCFIAYFEQAEKSYNLVQRFLINT